MIEQERERRKWSQKRLAQEAGVHPKTISRMEKGERVSPDTYLQVCAALGISECMPDNDLSEAAEALGAYSPEKPRMATSDRIFIGSIIAYFSILVIVPLLAGILWAAGFVTYEFLLDRVLGVWVVLIVSGLFIILFLGMSLGYDTVIRITSTSLPSSDSVNRLTNAIRSIVGGPNVALSQIRSNDGVFEITLVANAELHKHPAILNGLRSLGLSASIRSQ